MRSSYCSDYVNLESLGIYFRVVFVFLGTFSQMNVVSKCILVYHNG